jgi:hypothetical protein
VLDAAVDVRNWSDRPVRLVGGTSDYSCVTTAALPVTIPPGEARAVTIRLAIPNTKPGAFTRVAELWAEHPQWQTVWLRVGCQVVD